MTEMYQPVDPQNIGRTAQIIAGALIAGVLMFAAVAFFALGEGKGPDGVPMLSIVGAAFGGISLVVRFVVPSLLVSAQRKQLQQPEAADPLLSQLLAGLYQTKMIVGMAVLEGAAFINLTAFIMEKQVWTYGVVACLLAVMIVSFPSQSQFENWAEDMKRDL